MSAEEALDYIKSRPDGVLQSDLWKALKIDSRKCSRIVAKLLKDNLINREMETAEGIRTYRLCYVEKSHSRRFGSLLALDSFEPCAGCIEECAPEHCAKLSEWIFAIVMGIEGEDALQNE
ncbi:MAG: Lrp/AsnC family transcriptional regulator [Methanothrix sp.]|nr:Lrp/AsnC family transcriptional regulator [Methanothrix sp.]